MSGCIFCRIIEKEIPGDIVYEDEKVVAFNDIKPVAPVHILLVTRKHIPDLTMIDEEDAAVIGHIHQVAVQLAKKFEIDNRGFRIINNCKEEGGQEIKHLHFHLLGGRQMRGFG